MRFVRVLRRPGVLATLAVAVVLGVVERSVSGVALGLAGAAAGGLAATAASQLGLLAGALVPGNKVHRLVVGIGPRVADWSTPDRTVALRAIPVIISTSVQAVRTPVRLRIWVSALFALVAEAALVAGAALMVSGPFSLGFALATGCSLMFSLIPKRTASATSTGWLLFRLPSAPGDLVRQMEAAPVIGQAISAAHAGDLATAERLAARLRADYPELRSALAARVSVLEAQGRYGEAMILMVKLTGQLTPSTDPQEAASSYAAVAALACATVESGQLAAQLGLSTATQAMENAAALGFPSHKLTGTKAHISLLQGDIDQAITLARLAAGSGDSLLGRADDLATLARAHMAAGDNRTAREVLGEAEKLAKWWPRVATVRSRLEVS